LAIIDYIRVNVQNLCDLNLFCKGLGLSEFRLGVLGAQNALGFLVYYEVIFFLFDFVSLDVGLLNVFLVLNIVFVLQVLHALQWRLGATL